MLIDKNLMQDIYNSNEFKGWLISRRWFGDKSALSNLEFEISLEYFEVIDGQIFLSVVRIEIENYVKSYFLPIVYYKKVQEILEPSEKETRNIIKLTENTFSKKIAMTVNHEQKIITLNLIEAEYCILFWRKILFEKNITEKFPLFSLDLTLYDDQFQDEVNMGKVQNLIEAGLYPDRYDITIEQLGKGNTTNSLFQLNLLNKRKIEQESVSYVMKSYKEYTGSLEPSILFVLVKNLFPNAPKIYGNIRIHKKEVIGILEFVPNVGNLGDIYWNELNIMIKTVFNDFNRDYEYLKEKSEVSKILKQYCEETLKVSSEIGLYIKKLHDGLILPQNEDYKKEVVESDFYLKNYTQKLDLMISELLTGEISQKSKSSFFNLPKINGILFDIRDIIERFCSEFEPKEVEIQCVHQDLHMEQVLYNKTNDHYNFYFIDFEGDPELSPTQKKNKFPIEKDLASFLRSLSYIKFNTLLGFIGDNLIDEKSYEVPEEILYNAFFRKAARGRRKIVDDLLNVLNIWENRLMAKILKNLNPHITLINYFYIERALHELNYEILFRPNKIIVPILGLKEIVDKTH